MFVCCCCFLVVVVVVVVVVSLLLCTFSDGVDGHFMGMLLCVFRQFSLPAIFSVYWICDYLPSF